MNLCSYSHDFSLGPHLFVPLSPPLALGCELLKDSLSLGLCVL